ncbi:MAG TPA: ATP-binding cassette domain-containing protein [Nocardioides sp.]|uniref:ATP-binding cassette domain-containing protein n=1 Tax=Nocardioides sp. TaxID=35761 RepID=UPI002CC316C8|nr:ATP-binding cassette domain-containing protein [Nocardioides sp.]HTW13850.1 ATP-binding cassette domain-containing protein [Nocardioides sp.]
MTDAVVAEGLVKRYPGVTALDGLDLHVRQGSVSAVLGPNGAGKTTALRILTTLLRADAGHASVAGFDVASRPQAVRQVIGVSGQYAAVDEYLTGFENLDMVGRLYHLGRGRSRERARELLARFRLDEGGDRVTRTYSGGMRRRLDLAAALMAHPPVLFLDEPTTGLDPRSRADMWEIIRDLVGHGCSLLLTTQNLEEADLLADEIVVIDRGSTIAAGTADELKDQIGGDRLEIVLHEASDLPRAAEVLRPMGIGEPALDDRRRRLQLAVGRRQVLVDAVRRLDSEQIALTDAGVRRPTLDDVFLALTGRSAPPEAARSSVGPERPDRTPTPDRAER